jgi:hypothetical protein
MVLMDDLIFRRACPVPCEDEEKKEEVVGCIVGKATRTAATSLILLTLTLYI